MTHPRTVSQPIVPPPRESQLPKYLTIVAAVLVVLTGIVLVLVALTPKGGSPANFFGLGSFRITGSVTLSESFERGERPYGGQAVKTDDCAGSGGYADMKAGTQITVTDPNGKVIALGQLDTGIFLQGQAGPVCRLPFAMKVPAGHDFYGVEVAHRGVVRFTADEIRRELRLGPA